MSTMVITGRLGADAELRETTSNTKVVQFSIADKVGFGDKATTQWVKCTWFGDRAAKVKEYLTKGSIIEVSGSPSVEAWSDKQKGEARACIKINVQEVKLHGGGQRDSAEPSAARASRPTPDDEIPF